MKLWCMVILLVAPLCAFSQTTCPDEDRSGGSRLAVFFHAYTGSCEDFKYVHPVFSSIFKDSTVIIPDIPLGKLSLERPETVVAGLLKRIDDEWQRKIETDGKPYHEIVFIGFSVGGLLARKVYATAAGLQNELLLEPDLETALKEVGGLTAYKQRDWWSSIHRIVLLAGINRGWSISHHMSLKNAAMWSIGSGVAHGIKAVSGREPIIMSARRGSPFVTQLRLQWLNLPSTGKATVVQLLGTKDDIVTPEDVVDPVTGRDFIYLEVPFSGHEDVVVMDESPNGIMRRKKFERAFEVSATDQDVMRLPSLTSDAFKSDKTITDVIFVIHGIRDEGYWTEKLAYRVAAAGEAVGRKFQVETSSYGYFPMLSFLRPGARREKVEWLMDRYTIAKAKYPRARFSYIGHSHGTHMLAEALKNYPTTRFDNVVFAGSVVERDFEWSRYLAAGRVSNILNFKASGDYVVALFPKALEQVGISGLGGAGFDGFNEVNEGREHTYQLDKPPFVAGGHFAALTESWWDPIANFVISSRFTAPTDVDRDETQLWWIRILSLWAPIVWLGIAAGISFVYWLILRSRLREWKKTMAVVFVSFICWVIVTEI